jgi:hypothetical protein
MAGNQQDNSASCADLIRASISLEKMDCRIKPGNDEQLMRGQGANL